MSPELPPLPRGGGRRTSAAALALVAVVVVPATGHAKRAHPPHAQPPLPALQPKNEAARRALARERRPVALINRAERHVSATVRGCAIDVRRPRGDLYARRAQRGRREGDRAPAPPVPGRDARAAVAVAR